jgi:hypothetical protein
MAEISGLVLLITKITVINFRSDVLVDTGITLEIKLIILGWFFIILTKIK